MYERGGLRRENSSASFSEPCSHISELDLSMTSWKQEPSTRHRPNEGFNNEMRDAVPSDVAAMCWEKSPGFSVAPVTAQCPCELRNEDSEIVINDHECVGSDRSLDQFNCGSRLGLSRSRDEWDSVLMAERPEELSCISELEKSLPNSFINTGKSPAEQERNSINLRLFLGPDPPQPANDKESGALPGPSRPTGERSLRDSELWKRALMKRRRHEGRHGLQRQTKIKFTPAEDAQLCHLVQRYGTHNWTKMARLMPTKNRKQLRDRYVNFLSVRTVRQKFTKEEDKLILALVQRLGHQWNKIAQEFPDRCSIVIKNHYYNTLHRVLLSNASDLNPAQPVPSPHILQSGSRELLRTLEPVFDAHSLPQHECSPPHLLKPLSKPKQADPPSPPSKASELGFNSMPMTSALASIEDSLKVKILEEQQKQLQGWLLYVTQSITALYKSPKA